MRDLPVLPTLCESLVEIGADDALVQLGASNILHAVKSVLVSVVFDEAESARRLLKAVEAHDKALDLATLGKQLMYLLLGSVEGQVANIERGRVFELFVYWGWLALALPIATVLVAASVLRHCQQSD